MTRHGEKFGLARFSTSERWNLTWTECYTIPCVQATPNWARLRPRSCTVSTKVRGAISGRAAHVVDRNLELAAACGGSAVPPSLRLFPLPPGRPEGDLPAGDFVLASPLAGWASKQWPMEHYASLAARLRDELGIPLVLDGPPGADFSAAAAALPHYASLPGLIHATRRAAAIVGVDSGPLHLAAALAKPGVAIFGPTDPARNGPYGDSLRVLRAAAAATTYKRGAAIDSSMRDISPDEVFEVLRALIGVRRRPAGSLAE